MKIFLAHAGGLDEGFPHWWVEPLVLFKEQSWSYLYSYPPPINNTESTVSWLLILPIACLLLMSEEHKPLLVQHSWLSARHIIGLSSTIIPSTPLVQKKIKFFQDESTHCTGDKLCSFELSTSGLDSNMKISLAHAGGLDEGFPHWWVTTCLV